MSPSECGIEQEYNNWNVHEGVEEDQVKWGTDDDSIDSEDTKHKNNYEDEPSSCVLMSILWIGIIRVVIHHKSTNPQFTDTMEPSNIFRPVLSYESKKERERTRALRARFSAIHIVYLAVTLVTMPTATVRPMSRTANLPSCGNSL